MKNPSLTFRLHSELSVKTVDHYLHTQWKDYIYDYTYKATSEKGIPVFICKVTLTEDSKQVAKEIREKLESLLGDIDEYLTQQN